jgi:hypothetical protein
VRSVFVDRHGIRDTSVDLCTTTGDFGVPGLGRARLGFSIEATDQFERKSGTLLGGKTENFGEHVGRRHRFAL